jgi:hypothetical protein
MTIESSDLGGGATGGNSQMLSKITKGTSKLDSKGQSILYDKMTELFKQCGYVTMYNNLVTKKAGFNNIQYDKSISVAAYDPRNKNLLFNNNNSIKDGLAEEFIHMFQDNHYQGGLVKDQNTGRVNFEFEAKLLQDVLCHINDGVCPKYGIGKNYGSKYTEWIIFITKDGSYMPNSSDLMKKSSQWGNLNYWDFLKDFQQKNPHYNYPINPSLQPEIFNFLNKSNCK